MTPDAVSLFSAAKRLRSFEDVVAQIRTAILEGRLAVGDRLPNERELAAIFGVSRATLREALRTLEAFGAIESRVGSAGGIYVTEPSESKLAGALEALIRIRGATNDEVVEFAISIMSEIAYWSAVRAGEDDLVALAALVAGAASTVGAADGGRRLIEVHAEVISALATAGRNRARASLAVGLLPSLARGFPFQVGAVPAAVQRMIATDLGQIGDAVSSRNARAARVLMRRHLQRLRLEPERPGAPLD